MQATSFADHHRAHRALEKNLGLGSFLFVSFVD